MAGVHNWGDDVFVERRRTADWEFSIFEHDGATTFALAAGDVVRFKIYAADDAITLDVDSVAASANGSVVTVDQLDPAIVTVRLAQDDTENLPADIYSAELCHVDDSETDPLDAIKRIAHGALRVYPSGGGDVAKA
jgi:hypothetical protein